MAGLIFLFFFLSLLAGSEPVLRTNKQSKEANWWISYLIKVINTNPGYLYLESKVRRLNLSTTTTSVPQFFSFINIILQFFSLFFINYQKSISELLSCVILTLLVLAINGCWVFSGYFMREVTIDFKASLASFPSRLCEKNHTNITEGIFVILIWWKGLLKLVFK